MNTRNMYDKCKDLMFYHVVLVMEDGKKYDGIIEDLNDCEITVLVGENIMPEECQNSYSRQPNPMMYRRFRRRVFPLAGLVGLSLLAYPYFAGYYPPFFPFF